MKRNSVAALATLLGCLATATLSANVTILVTNFTPDGIASAGAGSGTGALTTTFGSIGTNRGMPVTSYTVSNLDFTSLGGTASESFTFTLSYSATTDGTTAGTAQFNTFGNVSVTGGASNIQVDGAETLTATIALTSSTFAGLSLAGLTEVRAGGWATGEVATFTWAGGSYTKNTLANPTFSSTAGITSVTLSVSAGQVNFEGFRAEFVAIPEPSTCSILAGALALGLVGTRRKRAGQR